MAPAARAWYLAEIGYLADRDAEAAARVVEMMRTARATLSGHPEIGRIGLIPGTRRLVAGPYVLTTRPRGGVVEIAAIRSSRQGGAYEPAEAKPETDGNQPG